MPVLLMNTYVLGGQHCPRPVATVRDFGGRSVGGSVNLDELGDGGGVDELVGLRLAGGTGIATGDSCSETTVRARDGEGCGSEKDLAEKSRGEHGGMKRRRVGVDSSGSSELGV